MAHQFHFRYVPREQSTDPSAMCEHHCDRVIQFISDDSNEVRYEICALDAEVIAKVFLEAIEGESRSLAGSGQ
ncbi:hypothetical protein LLE49_17065 [Alicyclobacillus tolerans]|uniref:hypothetical protein n=1 Tax=Alicyclobacillus tolerans TaxID=90970 RepID=UPI001F3FB623|nr:hypothetical protein [Alicyclobacillus tolerans]MCF8566435.1 hypothetical protein [Alicyclobacillus tolerans]